MKILSSTDATIHAAHDLIHALNNPAPASPLVKLGNAHKIALRYIAEIFSKVTP